MMIHPMRGPPPFTKPTRSPSVHQFQDGFWTVQPSLLYKEWGKQSCLYCHKNAEVLNKEFTCKSRQAITDQLVNFHSGFLLLKFNLSISFLE